MSNTAERASHPIKLLLKRAKNAGAQPLPAGPLVRLVKLADHAWTPLAALLAGSVVFLAMFVPAGVGIALGMASAALAATAIRRNRRAMAATHARFAAMVEHGRDLITVIGPDLRVLYASPAYRPVLGLDPAAVVGRRATTGTHPAEREQLLAWYADAFAHESDARTYDCRLRHADGTWRHIEFTVANRCTDPAVGGLVTTGRDVTERVEASERLTHQATHDVLTGLPNRAVLLERTAAALGRARASGSPCAVYVLDLDQFKRVNDSLGHAAGDQLLIAVAGRISEALRPADTIARLGGDEFVVLAEGMTSRSAAVALADRLLRSVASSLSVDNHDLSVTASVGIAVSASQSPDGLVQEADLALYRAKERGRNRWEMYQRSMRSMLRRELDAEQLVRRALAGDGVRVLYQPIVDLEAGTLVATEALVRLVDEAGQLVGPGEFISVSEDTGLIVELGAAVLDRACAQQAIWSRRAPAGPRSVSVNLSARQLTCPDLAESVAASLSRHGLDPSELCLELTESALLDGHGQTRKNIADLKDLGVRLAMDDFGTGWSSLTSLRRFPVDVLKVDRSFVAGLGADADDTEVVKAVVGLGHALGLGVVAEGVETAEQVRLLKGLHCDRAQGYYYGRPQEAARILACELVAAS